MLDSFTVARKELLEILGNRHSHRGLFIQAGVLIAIAGILVPAKIASQWKDAASMAALFFAFPAMLAAGVAADAFAGERERRTLETLLATPLSDRAIFAGKALSAILVSSSIAGLTLAAAIVTHLVCWGDAGALLPPATHIAAILGGAIGAASVATAGAISVSRRIAVARSAQQISSLGALVLTFALLAVPSALHVPVDWSTLPWMDLCLLAAGALGLDVTARTFRRDRIFDDR